MRFPAPIALPLLAAGLAAAAGAGARAADLSLTMNHSVRLALAGRAGSVVVGNPAVADVTVVDSRTVFLTGKGAGSTDVTVVDPAGRVVYAADVAVTAGPGRAVTIHRAGERAELNCNPRCLVASAPGGVPVTATPAAMAVSPAGAVIGGVGQAVSGGSASVGAAVPVIAAPRPQ